MLQEYFPKFTFLATIHINLHDHLKKYLRLVLKKHIYG